MNIHAAIKTAYANHNSTFPFAIEHKHRKDNWGLFTIYVVFTSISERPTWIRRFEDDNSVAKGDTYCANMYDYLHVEWEPSDEIPETDAHRQQREKEERNRRKNMNGKLKNGEGT